MFLQTVLCAVFVINIDSANVQITPQDCQKCAKLWSENQFINQQIGIIVTEKQLLQERNNDLDALVKALNGKLDYERTTHLASLSATTTSYQARIDVYEAEKNIYESRLDQMTKQINYLQREVHRCITQGQLVAHSSKQTQPVPEYTVTYGADEPLEASPSTPSALPREDSYGAMPPLETPRSFPVAEILPTASAVRSGIDRSRAKTRLCKNWRINQPCPFGDNCAFAHGEHELRNATDVVDDTQGRTNVSPVRIIRVIHNNPQN